MPINTNSSSSNDRIILDVGGTQFVSSKSTLSTNSSYFQALSSQTWTHETETETEKNKKFDFFVDQNPDAFVALKCLFCNIRGSSNHQPMTVTFPETIVSLPLSSCHFSCHLNLPDSFVIITETIFYTTRPTTRLQHIRDSFRNHFWDGNALNNIKIVKFNNIWTISS